MPVLVSIPDILSREIKVLVNIVFLKTRIKYYLKRSSDMDKIIISMKLFISVFKRFYLFFVCVCVSFECGSNRNSEGQNLNFR